MPYPDEINIFSNARKYVIVENSTNNINDPFTRPYQNYSSYICYLLAMDYVWVEATGTAFTHILSLFTGYFSILCDECMVYTSYIGLQKSCQIFYFQFDVITETDFRVTLCKGNK